jgi:hypothetical protein
VITGEMASGYTFNGVDYSGEWKVFSTSIPSLVEVPFTDPLTHAV